MFTPHLKEKNNNSCNHPYAYAHMCLKFVFSLNSDKPKLFKIIPMELAKHNCKNIQEISIVKIFSEEKKKKESLGRGVYQYSVYHLSIYIYHLAS